MTSTYNMTGIDELRHVLEHKVTAFAGPSGVGKSSLLNAVDPKFAFQTGEVSDKIKRGKHTTRHASLYSLDADSSLWIHLDLVLLSSMMYLLSDCQHYSPNLVNMWMFVNLTHVIMNMSQFVALKMLS